MREVNVSLRTKVQSVPSFSFVVWRLQGVISRFEGRVRRVVVFIWRAHESVLLEGRVNTLDVVVELQRGEGGR